jgi:microcystin degradation protein MlrC
MRLITGGIMHETHTFSVEPTTADTMPTWRGEELWRYAGTNHSMGGVIDGARARGIDLAPAMLVDGWSTGTPDRATFNGWLDELVERIVAALPADGLVLTLHGAMVAEGFPDAEAEIVRRAREAVGPDLPIAVTCDFHANLSQAMLDGCQIVTLYDTYPHVDIAERAAEAVDLLARTIGGEIRPVMRLVHPPLMPVPQAQFTARPPFSDLLAAAHAYEESGEALSVSVAGGFAYADVPQAGTSVLAITDGDADKAEAIALEIARMAWARREEMLARNTPPAEAVADAISWPVHPVVLVDVGDNIGGGTPGDGTCLLEELLRQGAVDATVCIADAEAAAAAHAAGEGHQLTITVGGKTDRLHGDPVLVMGRVERLTDGRFVHEGPENAGVPADMGPTALIRVDGVNLIVSSRKFAPGDLNQLRSVGIEPATQRILVVKAAVRWRAGYQPITRHDILVDTPGLGSVDLSRFDFRYVTRPVYPLDLDTVWDRA